VFRVSATSARYRVTAFAISLAALAYMQRVAISQAAPFIKTDLGLDKSQIGLMFGAFGLAYALFEIPNGLLGDRFGVRATLTRIVVAWSVFTALTGAAWNFLSMWMFRFLFGAGEAGCFPNLTRMLSTWLPERARLRAQALMWACSRWAGAFTPVLVLELVLWKGWRWAFVVLAVLGFIWAAVFHWWFRDDPATHPAVNSEELELLRDARNLTTQEGDPRWYRALLQGPVLILLGQYFCFSLVWYFYVTWLPTYLHEGRHVSQTLAAALSSLPLLFGGVGSLVGGYAAARVRPRTIAVLGFALSGVLLFLVTRVENTTAAMVLMGLASFCSDLTMPISWNACVEIGRRNTAAISGAMNMFGNFAGFLAPVVSGAILQATASNWNLLIYLMAAISLLAASCWFFLEERT
jgi:MFS transporter, ACS family, glucarate transporter